MHACFGGVAENYIQPMMPVPQLSHIQNSKDQLNISSQKLQCIFLVTHIKIEEEPSLLSLSFEYIYSIVAKKEKIIKWLTV